MKERAGVSRHRLLADGATQVAIGSDLVEILVRKLRLVVINEAFVFRITTSCIAHGEPVLVVTPLGFSPYTGHARNKHVNYLMNKKTNSRC